MPSPAAVRAGASILNRLGLASTLNGDDCGKVHVEHGVRVYLDDNVAALRNVATIALTYAPKAGDTLVHPDGTYVLDRLLQQNGVNARFIVR